MFLSVSYNEPEIKSETSGFMWHVALESKIQLVNYEVSTNFPLENLSLLDMRAIYAYIFWSLFFLLLLRERLTFSLKITCFCCFSLSFGCFGHFVIRWSSDPHLKHFIDVLSIHLLSEAPAAPNVSFSCLILVKHFLQSD